MNMNKFGGPALFLDRNDINTDEIIPAKYLTENSKAALKPYILEDLKLENFTPSPELFKKTEALVTRQNFGCGSSREHAVWVFEENQINLIIGASFARIFRQNMFNCGLLAIELSDDKLNKLFSLTGDVIINADPVKGKIMAKGSEELEFDFSLDSFDLSLIESGGWLTYADKNY
jgi:3-isopropylmalate/(R)-2-methylmalate dehydratase small subunit